MAACPGGAAGWRALGVYRRRGPALGRHETVPGIRELNRHHRPSSSYRVPRSEPARQTPRSTQGFGVFIIGVGLHYRSGCSAFSCFCLQSGRRVLRSSFFERLVTFLPELSLRSLAGTEAHPVCELGPTAGPSACATAHELQASCVQAAVPTLPKRDGRALPVPSAL